MNLLFIGIEPSTTLRDFLVSHDYKLSSLKRIPSKQRNTGTDLIAFAPKAMKDISAIHQLRTLFPKAWIALVIKPSWFGKSELQEILLPSSEYDDLWISDFWEKTFIFSHSRILKHLHRLSELRRSQTQCTELSSKSDRLVNQFEKDVALVSNIQRFLLPKSTPKIDGVTLAAKFVAAAGAGGDYYDIFEFGDKKRYGILLADSRSHGMAAALLGVLIKVRLEEMKEKFPDSKTFVDFLNKEIQLVHKKEMASLSLLYGIFDRSTLTFQYTVAGNLNPLLWRLGESAPLTTEANPALGEHTEYEFKESFITLKPADLLVFCTDGLEKTLCHKDQTIQERLSGILSGQDLTPDPVDTQNEVMALVDKYKEEHELPDDLTLIQFSINEHTLYVASESQ